MSAGPTFWEVFKAAVGGVFGFVWWLLFESWRSK